MGQRRKYIERISEENYRLDFYTLEGGLFVDFTDKISPENGCYYHFSQVENDWISAIKLVNLMKDTMKKEDDERKREAQELQ
jgi:hypothetical protein